MAILCWDFDGTIALSHHLWSNSVKKAIDLVEPENKIDFLDIRKCMATGFSWHTPQITYPDAAGKKWWSTMNNHFYKSYLSLGINEHSSKKASETVREIIIKTENYILYETAVDTLKKAKTLGHTNVIISNNYPELEHVMENLGIKKYFDFFAVSACIGYEKPRTEIFDIVRQKFKDNDYYMIGDSITADIIGGKNAGMKTILVHKGYNKNADFCADKLSDILTLI